MFGFKKNIDKEEGFKKNIAQEYPHLTLRVAAQNVNKSVGATSEKIRKLDVELAGYKEQIKKTRPGPAQEAIKAQALRIMKTKKLYEGQRETFNNLSHCIQRRLSDL